MKPISVKLSDRQVEALERIAAETGSIASTSIRAGKPSWRVLIKRIADGELEVKVKEITITPDELREMADSALDNWDREYMSDNQVSHLRDIADGRWVPDTGDDGLIHIRQRHGDKWDWLGGITE